MRFLPQQDDAKRWKQIFQSRPATMLATWIAAFFPAGTGIYIAVFIDNPILRIFAWIVWVIVLAILIMVAVNAQRLEGRNAISEQTKRRVRWTLWNGGRLVCAIAVIFMIWPSAPIQLRVQAGATLCGLIIVSRYLKPLLSYDEIRRR